MSVRTPAPAATECYVCSAPTGDDVQVCRTHEARLLAALRYVSEQLVADIETTLTRQDRAAVQEGARPGGERSLAWNERAAQVRDDLRGTLLAWCQETAAADEDERDRLTAVHHEPDPLARWLVRNRHTLRRLPDVGHAYDEILHAVDRGKRVVDLPTVSSSFYVGPCPELDIEKACCAGEVWAYISSSTDQPSWLRCSESDSHRWDTTRWLRAGRLILARKVQLRQRAAIA